MAFIPRYKDAILDIINSSHSHLSAEDIYLKLKSNGEKVVQATVYNNLNNLVEEGLIKRLSTENNKVFYDKTIKHDHLYCRKCGKIIDAKLEDLTYKIESQLGIHIESYDLKVTFICDDCKKHE